MTAHSETPAPRPAALEGWLEGLPAPSLAVAFNQEHQLITTVSVPGDLGGSFEVWTGDNGPGHYDVGDLFADDFVGVAEDLVERAREWAGRQHGVVAAALERELMQGPAAARIVAAAAGR